jgi:hypothetical protein
MSWDAKINSGSYQPDTGNMRLSPYSDTNMQLPIALHEVQHAVQHIEGFAPGTNPGAMVPHAAQEVINRMKSSGDPVDLDLINSAAKEAYMRHAGEVEARNVQTRMPMTPYQRSIVPPWATEDRAPGVQIVRPPWPFLIKTLQGGSQ